MRIAYITNVRLPSERAHGHQVARVCDALVKLGHEVTIFAPFRRNVVKEDFWTFHKADRKMKVKCLGTFDPIDTCWIPKFLQIHVLNWFFTRALIQEVSKDQFDVIYTRTPALLSALLRSEVHTVIELHTLPNVRQERFVELCNRCTLIVCLTIPMRDELVRWGVKKEMTTIEADGIDLEMFEARKGYVQEKYAAGYAGQRESMGLSKGIFELLGAFKIMHQQRPDSRFVIAGPRSKNHKLEKCIQEVVHEGYVVDAGFLDWNLIPPLLKACDVLVYPAPASNHPFYHRDTSPLKIFEYMAAGKPIVTANLAPIRDVLDETMAFFCKPGDPQDLARAIKEALENPEEAARICTTGLNALRLLAIYLKPVIPGIVAKIEAFLNTPELQWTDLTNRHENQAIQAYAHIAERIPVGTII